MKDWIVPVKNGADPFEDPFQVNQLKKTKRVVKNKLQQLKNLANSKHSSGHSKPRTPAGIPQTLSLSEGAVDGITGQGKKPKPKPKVHVCIVCIEALAHSTVCVCLCLPGWQYSRETSSAAHCASVNCIHWEV